MNEDFDPYKYAEHIHTLYLMGSVKNRGTSALIIDWVPTNATEQDKWIIEEELKRMFDRFENRKVQVKWCDWAIAVSSES